MANVVKLESRLMFTDALSRGPYAINTWHASYNPLILAPSGPDAVAEEMRAGVLSFFNDDGGDDDEPLGGYMSPVLSGVIQFSWYDLTETHPIARQLDDGILNDHGSAALPNQVALCLSQKCDPYGGHRRQSFYNRQYIGPLATEALGPGGRPVNHFMSRLLAGASLFSAALDELGVDTAHPCIYSPTHDSSGLATSAFVDNVFDTQRRRCLEETARLTLP